MSAGMNVRDKAHAEPARKQALLYSVKRLRRAVRGKDQPFAFGQQRVDRV